MPSLFCIEHALGDLFETRQELIEQVAYTDDQIADKQAALDAVDAAIVETVTAEVRKVDNISRFLLELAARRKAIHAEGKRLEALDDGLYRTETRIKEMVLQIMRDTDTKKLEGKLGTLRRQNNGGVLAVEVAQRDMVPSRFLKITATMPMIRWQLICEALAAKYPALLEGVQQSAGEPDLPAIRAELEKRVPCPQCKGAKRVAVCDCAGGSNPEWHDCDVCEGSGAVPNGVPGARLKERGESLRVS